MVSQRYCLEVRGEWACFTRPEMKVERVSYDVITPSAARAVFEAILWKPAIRWRVRRIEVLAPIRWANLRRNEVASVIPMRNVQQAMSVGRGALALYVDEDRQQRASLLLRDVAYRLHADLQVLPGRGDDSPPMKFFEMFERRARAGQCVNQPYLGCREFAASWRLVDDPPSLEPSIPENRDLGWMLLDMDFANPEDPTPRFFRAVMCDGVVEVPELDDAEVVQ
ncbi:MAG: type I-C CRISPR-associated protein Cas5 [Xanthomonadales bacterium]|nr:CRISPR pre-crRNA endoribonuclease Cas5d [Xanthomonadales bacterium]MCC6593495.1 type I-C CRISPR-associated protein Cas5 [Xanthomonadales bacterium]MCE7930117.1 type I-C CRISPR-associated protein Cas5 [Xanthomonadales bacterium PRO6]